MAGKYPPFDQAKTNMILRMRIVNLIWSHHVVYAHIGLEI
jgi:hypothetical protein